MCDISIVYTFTTGRRLHPTPLFLTLPKKPRRRQTKVALHFFFFSSNQILSLQDDFRSFLFFIALSAGRAFYTSFFIDVYSTCHLFSWLYVKRFNKIETY